MRLIGLERLWTRVCFALRSAMFQTGPAQPLRVPVFSGLGQLDPESIMGFGQGWLVANLMAYDKWTFADGNCPMNWRQGLKHDAAGVMELVRETCLWVSGATVPAKTSTSSRISSIRFSKELIWQVRAAHAGARASSSHAGSPGRRYRAAGRAGPRLWGYLQSKTRDFLEPQIIDLSRPTCICFSVLVPIVLPRYKVAISGLHKVPKFRAIGPVHGRPVMLDDTCYFLPCSTALEAAVLTALCNDPITLGFIASISFRDAKSPITKKLLQRLDFLAILDRADRRSLVARAQSVLSLEIATKPAEAIADVVERLEEQFRRVAK